MPPQADASTIQTEIKRLSLREVELNEMLKVVGEKIGRISQNPTFGDRFKAAFNSQKNSPLSKLMTERDSLQDSIRSGKEQRDAATQKLDDLLKRPGPSQSQPKDNSSPGVAPQDEPQVGQSAKVSTPTAGKNDEFGIDDEEGYDVANEEGLEGGEQSVSESVGESDTEKSVGESDTEKSVGESDTEKSVGESDTEKSVGESDTEKSVGESDTEKSVGESDTEKSVGESDTEKSVGESDTEKSVGESDTEKSVGESDTEKSVKVSAGKKKAQKIEEPEMEDEEGYDVANEDGREMDEVDKQVRSRQMRDERARMEKGEMGKLVEVEVEGVSGSEKVEYVAREFQMKSMGERYIKGEKETEPSWFQTLNGKDVTVHNKEWLREAENDKLAKTWEKVKAKIEKENAQNPDVQSHKKIPPKPYITEEQWEDQNLTQRSPATHYYNEEEKPQHQLTIEGGKFKEPDGSTGGGKELEGKHIFAMDQHGQVYSDGTAQRVLDSGRKADVHHSSFLAGAEVAGAGELTFGEARSMGSKPGEVVVTKGVLKEVSDRSGHYKPGEEQTRQTLESLEDRGLSLDNVKFTLDRGDEESEKTRGMAQEYLQGQMTPEEQNHRAQQQQSGKSVRDVLKPVENTFKARHEMADEIKAKGTNVRDSLRKTDYARQNEERGEKQLKAMQTRPRSNSL